MREGGIETVCPDGNEMQVIFITITNVDTNTRVRIKFEKRIPQESKILLIMKFMDFY